MQGDIPRWQNQCTCRAGQPPRGTWLTTGVDDTFDPYICPTRPDHGFRPEAHQPMGMDTTIPAAYSQYALIGDTRGFSSPQHSSQFDLGLEYVSYQPVETPRLFPAAEQGFGPPLINVYGMWVNGGTPLECGDVRSPSRCEMYPGDPIHLTTDISPESQVSSPREFITVRPTRRRQPNLIDFQSTLLADRRPAGTIAQRNIIKSMGRIGPPRWRLPSIS